VALAESTQKELKEVLSKNGIRFRSFWVQNTIAAYGVDEKMVQQISQRKDIARIFSGEVIHQEIPQPIEGFVDEQSPIEWNLEWIQATKLWALNFTGNGTTIGGADTGVEYTHPSLINTYRGRRSNGTFDHNFHWSDAVTNETFPTCRSPCGCSLRAPCDDQNHGSHSLATAAGGVHRRIGVSPNSKWIACRAFSDMGRHWKSSTFIHCLQFFLAPHNLDGKFPNPSLRPDTTVHSYGCTAVLGCPNHNDMEGSAISLKAAGVLMSVAAQNAGPSCGTVNRQPAHYESVVTVGALGVRTDELASFSSKGPVKIDGSNRRKPDLCAPGTNIISATLRGSYSAMSGTSMAAPHIAGAFALFWSAIPKLRGQITKTLTFFEKTAKHQRSTLCESKQESPNNLFGFGTIDVYKAYLLAKEHGY